MNKNLIKRCYAIAKTFHEGQLDRGGRPYLEHLIAVAREMKTEDTICAALLHDILEDTEVSAEDLIKMQVPPSIVYTVAILTRVKGETYKQYIARVGTDPDARIVKMADLQHNMNLSRLPEITEQDISRIENRYKPAYNYLAAIENERTLDEGYDR